jgi:hypothetical protein
MHNPSMGSPPLRALVIGGLCAVAVAAGCGGTTDDRPAKWSFISATIIEPSCATVNCHSAVAQRASVDLHDRETSYHALVDRPFVKGGEQSQLVALLRGQGAVRMPPDGPLPAADVDLIIRWIDAGANND